jgi:UDPglucose 6-dehydrogenase
MKIIIAGHGFVGGAVANTLKKNHELIVVDPKYTTAKIMDHYNADGIIICVNTPTGENGIIAENIANVLDQVPTSMPVLIKSTVTPPIVDAFKEIYPDHSICYSPEFLRAATADEDFASQTYMIIGGEDPNNIWNDIFRKSLKNLNTIVHCTPIEACMMKYATNCFLSVKVAFFNQLYDMCQSNGADYNSVANILKMDKRIGNSHMQVPGPDGLRGFGGACFPKDTKAFIKYAENLNTPITVLEETVKYNDKVRNKP